MKHLIHHTNHITIYAIFLLIIGISIRFVINRRRFNRRGIAGLQYFKSYTNALFITTIEKGLNFIAVLMIIGAIILYLIK